MAESPVLPLNISQKSVFCEAHHILNIQLSRCWIFKNRIAISSYTPFSVQKKNEHIGSMWSLHCYVLRFHLMFLYQIPIWRMLKQKCDEVHESELTAILRFSKSCWIDIALFLVKSVFQSQKVSNHQDFLWIDIKSSLYNRESGFFVLMNHFSGQ